MTAHFLSGATARRVGLLVVIAVAAQACDREQSVTAPVFAAPGHTLGQFTCAADVKALTLECNPSQPSTGGNAQVGIILGSQGSYVRLDATNVGFASTLFSADVTIQNLMGQLLGTINGTSAVSTDVFFYAGPTTTGGTGNVTVNNPSGTGVYLAATDPYFRYSQILDVFGGTSSSMNWQFKLDPSVTAFTFQVLLQTAVPVQNSILRWADEVGAPDNAPILAFWGSDSNNVFGATAYGTVLRYNGKSWTGQLVAANSSDSLKGIWGTSPSNVWTVGNGGTIYHYTGTSWSSTTSPTTQGLNAVWGSSASDVWAVGDAGTMLHYTGTSWATVTLPAADTNSYYAIWGTNSSNVWAVGTTGAIIKYNGTSWSGPQASGTSLHLDGVWGSSATDIYAIGQGHTVLHSTDGSTWGAAAMTFPGYPTTDSLTSIWGTGASNIWIASTAGYAYHYTGTSTLTANYSDVGLAARTVWGTSPTEVWLACDGGYLATTPPSGSNSWSFAFPDYTVYESYLAVFGTGANDVWAAGSEGTIGHWDGAAWTVTQNLTGGFQLLTALWASSPTDAWAVATDGTTHHYTGSSWTTVASGTGNPLSGIWGSSSSDVWAVGYGGAVDHYTGSSWSVGAATPNVNTTLYGVWGSASTNVYAVGYDNTAASAVVVKYNGSSWSTVSTGLSGLNGTALFAVGGTSATDVWIVGSGGFVAHYNGTVWTKVSVGTTNALFSVFPVGTSEVWVGGDNGTLIRWNGSSWTAAPSGVGDGITGIWGTSATNLYFVNNGGGVFHGNQ